MTTKPKTDRQGCHRAAIAQALLVGALLLPLPAAAQPAGVPPVPPRRHETAPPRPDSERFVWQPGHFVWDAAAERYAWRAGRHVVRRPGAARFVAGSWVQSGATWEWRRARWR